MASDPRWRSRTLAQAAPALPAAAAFPFDGPGLRAQPSDERHHLASRLLAVRLELGQAEAFLDDLAVAQRVEGFRRPQDSLEGVRPAGSVERGEVGAPRGELGGHPAGRRVADPEGRLARRDESLPARALDRGEVGAFPCPLGLVDVALPQGPIHDAEVPAPRGADAGLPGTGRWTPSCRPSRPRAAG